MKRIYCLSLNAGAPVPKPVRACYRNTRAIDLHIRRSGILISVTTGAEKDAERILYGGDSLFEDAVRKALLLYMIRYGKSMRIPSASVTADGKEQARCTRKAGDPPLIYCLTEGRLRIPFGHGWQRPGIERSVAARSKSNYDGRFAALHALLTAKSNRFEIERFTYYWMAMNALYSYTASLGEPLLPLNGKGKRQTIGTDTEKQKFLLRCTRHEPCELSAGDKLIRQNYERHLLWSAKAVLKRIPDEAIGEFCRACIEEDDSDPYVRQIRQIMKNEKTGYDYRFSVFSFMVMWVPYKLRCASFHGESSLPTFCYQHDGDLKVFRAVNRILDAFLTAELADWLDEDEAAQSACLAKIHRAAADPAYETGRKTL